MVVCGLLCGCFSIVVGSEISDCLGKVPYLLVFSVSLLLEVKDLARGRFELHPKFRLVVFFARQLLLKLRHLNLDQLFVEAFILLVDG